MIPVGDEGTLTLTVRMKVSPEPEVIDLLKRYRSALNYSIRKIIEHRATSLSKAHKLLYRDLREVFKFPSKIATDCYREALSIAKSWLKNKNKGRIPTVKTLRMWLTYGQGYRIKGDTVEITGGYKLKILGWDRRYDQYQNREARLIYRDGETYLMITKRIPKPEPYKPLDVLAIDINEKKVVVGNHKLAVEIETPIERAIHYKELALKLQEKYSQSKYIPWRTRRGILNRVRHFHRKAKNILEDWARKVSHRIVMMARDYKYSISREDLTHLVNALRRLSKTHRTRLILMGYRRLCYWIDWQCEKYGVPYNTVDPRGTSSYCPRCNTKLKKSGYRYLKCPGCGFEGDRDYIAVLNIRKKTLADGGLSDHPDCPVDERCGTE